jgi:hypothetical protein
MSTSGDDKIHKLVPYCSLRKIRIQTVANIFILFTLISTLLTGSSISEFNVYAQNDQTESLSVADDEDDLVNSKEVDTKNSEQKAIINTRNMAIDTGGQNISNELNPLSGTSSTSNQLNGDIFRVLVKVTNNAVNDEKGGIYLSIDNSDIASSILDITFPAKETITKTFEFNSRDVPVGKGFTAEVVYSDDYGVEVNGVNSPSKTPEVLQIFLGEPSAIDSDSKFKINVQVTNNGVIDQDGHIDADIKGTNIYRFIEGVFPAESTITKTFEFNSMNVPVGTGFKVSLTARDGQIQTQQTIHGINSPSQSPESVRFVLGSANKFIVNVQITNTADTKNYGFIRVAIPDSEIFKFASVDIPAKSTITKTFEFNSMDVPVGKGFDVNLSYGPTGKTEQSGINSPIKRPEMVQFTIP